MNPRHLILFCGIVLAVAFPVIVLAQPEATMMTQAAVHGAAPVAGAASSVLSSLIQVLAVALGTLLTGLVTLLVAHLNAKYKLNVSSEWTDMLGKWIDQSVHYAEEWAKQQVRTNATITGADKLNTAAKFLLTMVDDKKLTAMGEDKLRLLIEARLNSLRSYNPSLLPAIPTVKETP